jgi:hypothetical protein
VRKELFLRFPYHPFQTLRVTWALSPSPTSPFGQFEQRQELSMSITCFRNEPGCDIYSSSCPWQAQAAATVAPTHQDILNPWIPIPVNIGFFELTKATTPRSIVMSEMAAPFANPSNSNI